MIGLGIMSGSSLDGIDAVLVEVNADSYTVLKAQEFKLSDSLKERLRNSVDLRVKAFLELETNFTQYIAQCINESFQESFDFIAVHGHTTVHLPEEKISNQMVNGGLLSALTKTKVITDFRIGDLGLNGVGTPLVSIVEKYLFKGYNQYLNLGGIANITMARNWNAFDVCPCNQLSNHVSRNTPLGYDHNGEVGKSGHSNSELYAQLNQFDYYKKAPPKSLDNNWIGKHYFSILDQSPFSDADKLATIYNWIADKVVAVLEPDTSLFVTGGGVHNSWFLKLLMDKAQSLNVTIVIPEKVIIDNKESILMAYLGFLRIQNIPNIMSSVTGATMDSVGGAIYNVHGK